jgi:hypothetical protein
MPRQPNGEGNGGGPPPPPPPHHPYTGPNYAGFVFTLDSSSGKPAHGLTISTQADQNIDYIANITGLWYPYGDDANARPITGYIAGNGDAINCTWTTSDGYNVLQGTLTYSAETKSGLGGRGPGMARPSAYLDGTVTAYDANGNVLPGKGPGPVSGTGEEQQLAAP